MRNKSQQLHLEVIFRYLLGGFLGFILGLFFLQFFYIISGFEAIHTFLFHWLYDESLYQALVIIIGFILTGIGFAGWLNFKNMAWFLARENESLKEMSQAKSEAITFIAHQLRTPISSSQWGIEMLLEGEYGQVPIKQKKLLTKIYNENRDLIESIINFLDVSKLETGKLEISLKSIKLARIEKEIKEVVEKIRSRARKKKIALNYSSSLNYQLFIQVDLKRISQVVDNLLRNAIDYTLVGGKVKIFLENNKDNFKFSIFDTGIGIPQKQQSKVFNKFFRATNARKLQSTGTGLGLYLCKKIIEGHQGKIWFSSEENKGTLFTFTIPLKTKVEIEELFRKI